MAIDTTSPRTRRALLAGASGALAALAAQALGRPTPVRAEDEPIVVGGEYVSAISRTRIRNNMNGEDVLVAESAGLGNAVVGYGISRAGVYGASNSGVGVRAYSDSSFGLRVEGGRIKADQVSGVATIAAGASSNVVSPGVNVVSGSFVLLTPMAKLGGRDLWFTKNTTADTFTIRMSSARTNPTKVAWLLLG